MDTIKRTDVLIVGSGLSGLATALMIPDKFEITLITKDKLSNCSTAWAQGGIAAVLASSDSFKKHFDDTVENGHGLVDESIAASIIKEGPDIINWLTEKKVKFTKTT